MKLNITDIKELENGGAEIIFNMDAETQKFLLNYAIIEILKNGLAEVQSLHEQGYKDESWIRWWRYTSD